jgi:RimJ/RimL family protein N-acetyltransferase
MRDIIKTKRLLLRPITMADAEAMAQLAGDFDIARMTGSIPHPFPVLSAEIRVTLFEVGRRRGLQYAYAITQDGGALMGIISLFRPNTDADFEIGYWIGKPYWQKGYMTEACKAIIHEAKHSLGLTTITAGVFSDNPASIHILKKLGFVASGPDSYYFSISRLCKAKSLSFVWHATPALLREGSGRLIEATS